MLLSNEISKLPNSVYSLRKKTHQDSLIFSNALKSENSKVFVKKRKQSYMLAVLSMKKKC